MKHPILSALVLVWLSTAVNAQRSVLLPEASIVPGFRDASDLKLTASLQAAAGDETSMGSASVAIAYAPTGHLMIAGSYHAILDLPETDLYLSGHNEVARIKGNSFEGGAGYFRTIGKQGHAELLMTYGNGSLQRRSMATGEVMPENYDAHYHCLTIQPAVGITNNKSAVECGFSYRLRNFYEFDDATSKGSMIAGTYSTVSSFINLEAGSKLVRFNVQAGVYNPIGRNAFSDLHTYLTLGLALHFSAGDCATSTKNSFIVSY